MGGVTTKGDGFTLQYTTTASGSVTASITTLSGLSIASGSGNTNDGTAPTAATLSAQLDSALQNVNGDIARESAAASSAGASLQAELAKPNPSQALVSNYQQQIATANSQITASQNDAKNITEAKTYVLANYDKDIAAEILDDQKFAADNGDTAAPPAPAPQPATTPTPPPAIPADKQANLQKSTAPTGTVQPASSTPAPQEPAPEATTPDPNTLDPISVTAAAIKPRPNPLHDFVNYTYGLSLHFLPPQAFTDLVNQTTQQTYTPTTSDDGKQNGVLIASAGRSGDALPRNIHFTDDFYFEDLKMTTIVGLNSRTRGTNAIDISFTIIEPYGITMIDRLIDVCKEFKVENYIETPYLLQIDFFGYNQDGSEANLTKHTKYIPIRIIGMTTSVSEKGATYKFQAVPYCHAAFQETYVATPANFEIYAGTVHDFFNYDKKTTPGMLALKKAKDKANDRATQAAANQALDYPELSPDEIKQLQIQQQQEIDYINSLPYKAGSYTQALNTYHKNLLDGNKIQEPDEYLIVIDDALNSPILTPKDTSHKKSPMINNTNVSDVLKLGLEDLNKASGFDTSNAAIAINAGTSIIDVINMVMRNSKYILSQLDLKGIDENAKKTLSPEQLAAVSKKTLKWFKIIPQVTILKYDAVRNTFAKRFIYYVKPYEVNNTKYPYAPNSLPSTWIKEYNYIYTGQNVDVIDLKIDFDMAFYTSISSYLSNRNITSGAPDSKDSQGKVARSLGSKVADGPQVMPLAIHHIPSQQHALVGENANTAAAVDLSKSLYTNSKDMINLDLKIIGDPEFIKQDEVFISSNNIPVNAIVDKNNSCILFDNAEIYMRLTFDNPTDIDTSTGGIRKYNGSTQKVFDGIYRILKVDNMFQAGVFTQTLQAIRLFNQDATTSANIDAGRPASGTTSSDSGIRQSADILPSSGSTLPNPAPIAAPTTTISAPPATGDDAKLVAAVPATPALAAPANADQQKLANVAATGTTVPIQAPAPLPPVDPKVQAAAAVKDAVSQINSLAAENAQLIAGAPALYADYNAAQAATNAFAATINTSSPNATATPAQEAQYNTLFAAEQAALSKIKNTLNQINQNASEADSIASQATATANAAGVPTLSYSSTIKNIPPLGDVLQFSAS